MFRLRRGSRQNATLRAAPSGGFGARMLRPARSALRAAVGRSSLTASVEFILGGGEYRCDVNGLRM